MSVYKHILFATDLSSTTSHILERARKLAETHHAKLSVVHVVEPLPAYASGYLGVVDLEAEFVEKAIHSLADLCKTSPLLVNEQRVEIGSPRLMILEVAKQLGVDLIMIGTHGRHGFNPLLGSTASSVLHGAHCDVLLVKHPE